MELQQIQRVGRKISQTVFDPGCQILPVVTFFGLLRETTAGFGCDKDLLLAALLQLGDQAFASPVAVHIGSVDKIDSAFDGLLEGGERLFVRYLAPGTADSPPSEADFRYVPTCSSEWAVAHRSVTSPSTAAIARRLSATSLPSRPRQLDGSSRSPDLMELLSPGQPYCQSPRRAAARNQSATSSGLGPPRHARPLS